jgi:hypothetical protein
MPVSVLAEMYMRGADTTVHRMMAGAEIKFTYTLFMVFIR